MGFPPSARNRSINLAWRSEPTGDVHTIPGPTAAGQDELGTPVDFTQRRVLVWLLAHKKF